MHPGSLFLGFSLFEFSCSSNKGAKPREIAEFGSLYCLIITYFLQELRPYLSQLGTNPLVVEFGTAGFLHEPIYNKLASASNDSTHESLKSFVLNHDIYVTSGVQKEAPTTLDELSALAVSQSMEFINKHYRQARRWQVQSGNHKPLLKQQHDLIRADSTLNTKGTKQQVYKDALEIYGDIREGLSREQCMKRALKAEPRYDSNGSKTMGTKQAIEQHKLAAEHALLSLNNRSEEDATVQPSTAKNNKDMPETHLDVNDDSCDSESN
jgi:hypothetical protein